MLTCYFRLFVVTAELGHERGTYLFVLYLLSFFFSLFCPCSRAFNSYTDGSRNIPHLLLKYP